MAAAQAPEVARNDRHGDAPPVTAEPRRRGLRDRLSAGHWLVLIAFGLAFTLNYALLRGGDERIAITVAAATIVPGQVVTEADLRVTHVGADDLIAARFVGASDVDALLGGVATTRIATGDPLPRSAVVPAQGADLLRTMSIPIDPAHAVGGDLRAGDRIDVITVGETRARYIAEGVEIVAVADRDGGGALGAHLAGYHVVLAVDPVTALQLAAAVRSGGLEIIRATGSSPLGEAGLEVEDPFDDEAVPDPEEERSGGDDR